MPPKTIEAFLDHGVTAPSLTADIEGERRVLSEAERLGLDLAGVTAALVVEGVDKFEDAADALLGAIAKTRSGMLGDRLNGFEASLPETLQSLVEDRLERARAEHWSRRLWAGDATLWTGRDEDRWLGWLAAGRGAAVDLEALSEFAAEAREYQDIVLLGMGGSSLGPEVIGRVLGSAPGHPRCTCSTAAIPARSPRSPQRSIRRAPCSSSPANPVRRWSRSCCGPISSIW